MNTKLFIQIVLIIIFVFACYLVVQYIRNKPSLKERVDYALHRLDERDKAIDDFIKAAYPKDRR